MSAAPPNLSPNAPVLRGGRNRDDDHLVAMQRHWKAYRTFPPMSKLATVLGLSSTAGVFGVIGRLTDAGYLQRVDRRIAPTKRFFERVEHVECHCPRQFPLSNLTRSKHLADASNAQFEGATPTWQRLSLLAHVTLVSDGAAAS